MATVTLKVVATIIAQPDKVDQLKSILVDLLGPTRAEAGCITYDLQQSNSDASEFVFVEEWTSNDALDEHLATAHLKEAMTRAEPLLARAPEIRRYTNIG